MMTLAPERAALSESSPESNLPPPQEITWEQYLMEGDVEGSYEIIEGVRYFMPGAKLLHQIIAVNLSLLFGDYQRRTQRGRHLTPPLDVVIRRAPRLQTRQPDLLFFSTERFAQAFGESGLTPIEVAPEIVIEILSPSDTPRRLRAKLDDYHSIGVLEIWLVSPEGRTIQLLQWTEAKYETAALAADGQSLTSLAFPDLTIALAEIFTD